MTHDEPTHSLPFAPLVTAWINAGNFPFRLVGTPSNPVDPISHMGFVTALPFLYTCTLPPRPHSLVSHEPSPYHPSRAEENRRVCAAHRGRVQVQQPFVSPPTSARIWARPVWRYPPLHSHPSSLDNLTKWISLPELREATPSESVGVFGFEKGLSFPVGGFGCENARVFIDLEVTDLGDSVCVGSGVPGVMIQVFHLTAHAEHIAPPPLYHFFVARGSCLTNVDRV